MMSLQSDNNNAMSFVAVVLILLVSIAKPIIGFHLVAQPMTTTTSSSSRVVQQQQWRRTTTPSSPLFVAAPLMDEEMDQEEEQHHHPARVGGGLGKIVEIESPNEMAEFIAEDDRLCIVK